MITPQEKYLTDPDYKMLVDWMVAHIEKCNYTPSEMREASILASIKHEQMQVIPNIKLIKECFEILNYKGD